MTRGVKSVVGGFAAFRLRQKVLTSRGFTPPPERKILDQAKICVYCWRRSEKWLEFEHIIPLTRGGKHEWANVAMVCARCNRSKGNRFLLEWVMSNCPGVRPCFSPPILPSEVRGAA